MADDAVGAGPHEGKGRVAKILIALAVGGAVYLLTRNLPDPQGRVAAVFAFTVALWILEALPLSVTALLSSALLVLVAGRPESEVFGAYGNQILFLFIGSFTLAKAFEFNGLHERLAGRVLGWERVRSSPYALLLAMGAMCTLVSSLISSSATTAMMLPIALTLLARIGHDDPGAPLATAMMLMLTWGASVAIGTPIATPPNLIGLGMLEEASPVRISFGQWMTFAMPVSLVMLLVAWSLLCLLFLRGRGIQVAVPERAQRRPMHAGERNTLIVLGVALALWVGPSVLTGVLGAENALAAWADAHIKPAVVALLAMALLYVLPAPGTPTGRTLTWEQGRQISWGTVMLFGGGLALGRVMDKSGLAQTIGDSLVQVTGVEAVWGIALVAGLATILASELSSNTAAVTAMVPIVIGICEGANVSPVAPVLTATLCGSLGFMLPVSTAPNAIVYSSGLVSARQMLRSGLLVDIAGLLVVWSVLRLILPLMGLA